MLGRIIEDNRNQPLENKGAQVAWDARRRSVEERINQLQAEINRYAAAKGDVRDVKAKAETKLRDAQQELEKINRAQKTAAVKDRPGRMATDYYWWYGGGDEALDYLRKEMVTMEMAIPEKFEPRRLPPFKIDCWDDLIVAARANLDAKAKGNAGKATDAAGKAMPVYILKDGRRIKSKIAIEDGENVVLKTEDNKMVTIKKSEIEGIGNE